MLSAELALTIPSILLVLAICLTALALGVDQVRCADAARVAARAASRGEVPDLVRELAVARAPEGSSVLIQAGSEGVEIVVAAPSRARVLPGLPVAQATASAQWEPGAGP